MVDSSAKIGDELSLGDYQLTRELGHGGMGTVYLAQHKRLGKQVAIKELPKDKVNDKEALSRFQREMKAVGGLSHPNIIQAHDAREEQGHHFLVLEYLDGADLNIVVENNGQLKAGDACEIIRQAALGLQHAHEAGLVHRDIKPSNIFLTKSGSVKVLDLGLALLGTDVPSEVLTSTGQIMGTVDYIAPEQIADTHDVDIRADIYSLGCTFFKLLTGQPPFASCTSILRKMKAHAEDTPPSVSMLRTDVPSEVLAVLEKMTKKSEADRYSSPGEIAEALEPFCKDFDLADLLQRQKNDSSTKQTTLTESFVSKSGLTETLITPAGSGKSSAMEDFVASIPPGTDAVERHKKDREKSNAFPTTIVVSSMIGIILLMAIFGPSFFKKPQEAPPIERVSEKKERQRSQGKGDAATKTDPPPHVKEGFALEFDGIDDHITIPMDGINVGNGFTIEGWIRFDHPREATNPVDNRVKVFDWSGPVGFELLQLRPPVGEVGNIVSNYRYGQGKFLNARNGREEYGRRHVALVKNGEVFDLYINGIQTPALRTPNDVPYEESPRQFVIGSGAGGQQLDSWHFRGSFSEFRVSNVARYTGKEFDPPASFASDEDTIALYHFDEAEGDVLKDSSGNEHHGTIHGNPKWVKADESKPNLALEFDGIDDYVEVPTLNISNVLPLTIESWLTYDPIESTESAQIVTAGGLGFKFFKTNLQSFVSLAPDATTILRKNQPVNVDQGPHHVALVVGENHFELFFDGIKQPCSTEFRTGEQKRFQPYSGKVFQPKSPYDASVLVMGSVLSKTGAIDGFRGMMHQLRISKSIRYKDDFQPSIRLEKEKETLALYHFDEGTGDVLKDSSGNGHHGMIHGANWVPADKLRTGLPDDE